MKGLEVPYYLIEEDQEPEQKEEGKAQNSKYLKCPECQEYVHVNDQTSHRTRYCDPGHKRKKQFVTREKPRKMIGGYLLMPGVDPRPIADPPEQVLRGKCHGCGVTLAVPDDVQCVVCAYRSMRV